MEGVHGLSCSSSPEEEISPSEETMELRRGPWTVEEDVLLMNYIANHGEGRWNLLAQAAGLNRTGKSCRLRWLNYLRPDVRRGNITLEEQLKILELHSRWGNRWSKIAKYLPGRTDNEIKNYWRTRVQKHAKQLRCDVNSKLFKDTMRYIWMPRLVERIQAAAAAEAQVHQASSNSGTSTAGTSTEHPSAARNFTISQTYTPENSSDSLGTQFSSVDSDLTDSNCHASGLQQQADHQSDQNGYKNYQECLTSPCGFVDQGLGFQSGQESNVFLSSDATWESLWSEEEIWLLQQQLSYGL